MNILGIEIDKANIPKIKIGKRASTGMLRKLVLEVIDKPAIKRWEEHKKDCNDCGCCNQHRCLKGEQLYYEAYIDID